MREVLRRQPLTPRSLRGVVFCLVFDFAVGVSGSEQCLEPAAGCHDPAARSEAVAVNWTHWTGHDYDICWLCEERPESAYLVRFSQRDRSALRGGPRELLVTWTTGEETYLNLALNMAFSVRRFVPEIEEQFVVVALDQRAEKAMRDRRFRVVRARIDSAKLKDEVWKTKYKLALTLRKMGFSVLLVDADMVMLRDPFSLAGHGQHQCEPEEGVGGR